MKYFLLLAYSAIQFAGYTQSLKSDSIFIRSIYDEALVHGESYETLRSLCKDVGNRLSGSKNAEKAVEWGLNKMKSYQFDSVYLQEVMVPKWERGNGNQITLNNEIELDALALGLSVGTDGQLNGEVIAVSDYDELEARKNEVNGKVVFFTQPMDPRFIDTFKAYGNCSSYRVRGASRAAKYGATAILIRSLTLTNDEHPHTGVMIYEDSLTKIPGVALSVQSALKLENYLSKGMASVQITLNCRSSDPVKSYNVIGEIHSSEKNAKWIAFGGHLDSWDVGEGAHDDGAGVAHSIEAMRILKKMNYKPKNNLRAILFMNEENGNRGGWTYAEKAEEKGEVHLAALESDRGGFSPRGFSIDAKSHQFAEIESWKNLLEPYQIHLIYRGFGGVDISPLRHKMKNGVVLMGLVPDSQRYFDYHHAETDVFEAVNKRELELGAAAFASMIFLLDSKLIKDNPSIQFQSSDR